MYCVCIQVKPLQSSGSEKSRFEKKKKKKRKKKVVVCKQMRLGQTERVETSNANPFRWATAESLSTVSATTDSCGAGEAAASKVGAGEREGTKDGVDQS